MAKGKMVHLSVLSDPHEVAEALTLYVSIKEKIEGLFMVTEGHSAHTDKGIPVGNLCGIHERSKEYAVYTSYVDEGKPTKGQLRAFQLIELLKEVR